MTEESLPVYDEIGSKLLVMALVAQTDAEIVSAVNGLRRHMGGQSSEAHSAKIFYAAGPPGTWMSSIIRLMNYANDRMIAATNERSRYKARLAVVEAALRRIRNVLKAVGGSDTKDQLLQWDIERATESIPDTDVTDDPTDMALARLYARAESEMTES